MMQELSNNHNTGASFSVKKYAALSAGVGALLGIALFASMGSTPKTLPTVQKASIIDTLKNLETHSVTLAFVGDIMLGRGVKTSVYKNFAGDYDALFSNVTDIKNADIAFANLEGPVTDTGVNAGSKYSFMFEPKVTEVLKNAGFDIVSIANNHAGDRSLTGFQNTILNLQKSGILFAGGGTTHADAGAVKIIEKNGVKIGFLGFTDVGPEWLKATDATPGILLAKDPEFDQIIKNARTQVDTLIVSFHWGEEYKYNAHTARQAALAHRAIDDGAQIIVGHHPHVAEDIESYKGGLIMYSLGNFIFDQPFSQNTMRGMTAFITIKNDGTLERNFKTIVLNSKYQPDHFEDSPITEGKVMSAFETGYYDEEAVAKEVVKKSEEPSQKCEIGNPVNGDPMFLNVGQEVALPSPSYVPPDLTALPKSITGNKFYCLRKEAGEKLTQLITDAKEDNISIEVSSGFRSYKTQQEILSHWISIRGTEAYKRVAKPGYSEHQLGTAVDLSGKSINFSSAVDIFGTSPEAVWLEKNAYKYGFIRSYPEGKEDITGYAYEPWHYRYVGIDYALQIKQSGKTITEFLAALISNINIGG